MKKFTILEIGRILVEPFCRRCVRRTNRGQNVQGGLRVSSPDELRSYAVDCARLANAASNPHDKARLLNMARAWTDLADRIEKIREVGGNMSPIEDAGAGDAATMPPIAPPASTECGGTPDERQ